MQFFLKIKHWQLFLLSWGIPLIMSFFTIGNVRLILTFFPYQIALFAFATVGWIWSIAVCLHGKLPAGVNLNLTSFKIMFAIPVVYLLGIMIWMAESGPASGSDAGMIGLIIVPVHLLSMACIFLCMRFSAKVMKSVELGRIAKFGDYAGEFFMIWFMPVGIWALQPRLNKLIGGEKVMVN